MIIQRARGRFSAPRGHWRKRSAASIAALALGTVSALVAVPAAAAPQTRAEHIAVSADTTLQSWQSEKRQTMADKPYIGALLPHGYGIFGEKFESADISDKTDAKMGLLEFDLSAYDQAPQQAELHLTYMGFRGNKAATDGTKVRVSAVDTHVCTNDAATCPAATATWATRPRFAVTDDTLTAESSAFTYGTVNTGDSMKINPANTQKVTLDVTPIVKAWFASGKKTITFALQETTHTEVRFVSSEGAYGSLSGASADMAPQLRVVPQQSAFTLEVTPAHKLTYQLNEEFNPAGVSVILRETATGKQTALSPDQYVLDSSAFDNRNIGSYPITVTYKKDRAIGTSFHVHVVRNVLDNADSNMNDDDILWYENPASDTLLGSVGTGNLPGGAGGDNDRWQRTTLPIGNGKMGGTVWGNVSRERVTFNEETLWTGGPGAVENYNGGNNINKGRNGAALRQLNAELENGAQTVSNTSSLTGGENAKAQGAYQNWGNLYIDYGFDQRGKDEANASAASPGVVTNYQRSLNISKGLANVQFTRDGVDYKRQYFVSNPDNVMVARLSASKAMDLALTFPTNPGFSKSGETSSVSGDTLTVRGDLKNNGLHYNAQVKAVLDDGVGTVQQGRNGELKVSGATGVTLYIAAGTDYQNTYPTYRSGEDAEALNARIATTVQAAANKGFDAVKATHIADHNSYYDRVTIDLGQSSHTSEGALATDALVEAYKKGTASAAHKRELEMLVYQYGRYLTIASSRENSQLPSNLQGIWSATAGDNAHGVTPWGSDFHLNVNLQMNYWPVYSGNLAELAQPLIAFAESLVEPGRVTANVYAGAQTAPGTPIGEGKGYMAHTENTAYGWTTPGFQFSWGWSPAAMPWLLQNVYEAWEFTGDTGLLKDRVYPLLKEEANFYVNYMLHKGNRHAADGELRLTTGVAYSPEHGPLGTDGNTYESTLVWQLLNDAIESAKALGVDKELVADAADLGVCSVDNWRRDSSGQFADKNANRSWGCALKLLKPIEVGASGQIKEWFFEGKLGHDANGSKIAHYQGNHRHLSHLLGLFPADLITVDNAEYMDAAKVSLTQRGDDATGWGVGQRINSWARTGDGNHAYQLIEKQLKNAIYPNLFDAHPPFQIDGNFGNTSGVNEMLLQSNSTFTAKDGTKYHNYMHLLPALPQAWADSGFVKGLVARGNFVVDMSWKAGSVETLQLTSRRGNTATLALAGADKMTIKDVTPGIAPTSVTSTLLDAEHLTFDTVAGHVYNISPNTADTDPVLPDLDNATAVAPAAHDPGTCTVKPVVDIPDTEGVHYILNGDAVPAGKYVYGYGEKVKLQAKAQAGYKLTNPDWAVEFASSEWESLNCGDDAAMPPMDTVVPPTADAHNPDNPSLVVEPGNSEPLGKPLTQHLSNTGSHAAWVILLSMAMLVAGVIALKRSRAA